MRVACSDPALTRRKYTPCPVARPVWSVPSQNSAWRPAGKSSPLASSRISDPSRPNTRAVTGPADGSSNWMVVVLRNGFGAGGITALAFDVVNRGAAPETLQALTVHNTTTGPGSQTDLDANWLPFEIETGPIDAFSRDLLFNPLRLKETGGVARVFSKTETSELISRVGFGFRQNIARSFLDVTGATDETERFTTNDGGFEFAGYDGRRHQAATRDRNDTVPRAAFGQPPCQRARVTVQLVPGNRKIFAI